MIVFEVIFGIIKFIFLMIGELFLFNPIIGVVVVVAIAVTCWIGFGRAVASIEDKRNVKAHVAVARRRKTPAQRDAERRQRIESEKAGLRAQWIPKIHKADKRKEAAWKALQKDPHSQAKAARYTQREREASAIRDQAERFVGVMFRRSVVLKERQLRNPTPAAKPKPRDPNKLPPKKKR